MEDLFAAPCHRTHRCVCTSGFCNLKLAGAGSVGQERRAWGDKRDVGYLGVWLERQVPRWWSGGYPTVRCWRCLSLVVFCGVGSGTIT